MLLLSHLPPRLEGAKAWPFVIRLCTSTFTSFTVNCFKLCKKYDIKWYQLISHPCPSTLHKHCKDSAMLWHSLDALALSAFRACDWETLALMQSLIISYLRIYYLIATLTDLCFKHPKKRSDLIKDFVSLPKEIKQVYQYRDIPWYTVICRDICDICDTRWPCLPDLATWQAWSASTKAKTPSLKQHLQDICRMALNKEWFSRHQYGLCCIRTWNSYVSRYFMIFLDFTVDIAATCCY